MQDLKNRSVAWGAGLEDSGDGKVVTVKTVPHKTLADALGITHHVERKPEGLTPIEKLQNLAARLKYDRDYLRTYPGQSLAINMMSLAETELQTIIHSMKENNA